MVYGYIPVPKDINRDVLVREFGALAVSFYEARIAQRESEGKIYLNKNKTIYLWAYADRQTHQGFYTTFRGVYNRHKTKNKGGS